MFSLPNFYLYPCKFNFILKYFFSKCNPLFLLITKKTPVHKKKTCRGCIHAVFLIRTYIIQIWKNFILTENMIHCYSRPMQNLCSIEASQWLLSDTSQRLLLKLPTCSEYLCIKGCGIETKIVWKASPQIMLCLLYGLLFWSCLLCILASSCMLSSGYDWLNICTLVLFKVFFELLSLSFS